MVIETKILLDRRNSKRLNQKEKFKVHWKAPSGKNTQDYLTVDFDNQTQVHIYPAKMFILNKQQGETKEYVSEQNIDLSIDGKKITLKHEILNNGCQWENQKPIKMIQCWGDGTVTVEKK